MSSTSGPGRELNELLERGEISPEAYAEYAAAADVALASRADNGPHVRKQPAMFDHITLRVADLERASTAFGAVLDELGIEQTTSTPTLSVWGNFALTQPDDAHPIARRVHIAFVAPTPAHVDRFWQAGIDAGFTDDGPAGPRRVYADDYYAAFLKDPDGNSFEAVYRDGTRPRGSVDHVAIRVSNVEASTAFYSTIGDAAGLTLQRQSPDSAAFAVGASDGSLLIFAGEPTQNMHIAFSGEDDDVRRFHAEAAAAGYRSNGEPGERPRYHAGYYAAYVLDPDGNNIEVVDHHR
ncbi:MAG: Glyoxalase/bleomycin resistance protein/dioxygenase [Actinomycetia bacterium]|nr:Glyoxalase/bleomycin resistance protein/dioxygenase [Actinomycetes bacterium]